MSVETRHITKLFGKQKALYEVSFSIKKGELVGFLGPNGAGKSTMMKIITGFLPADSGEVIVNGQKVVSKNLEIRKNIGYLPEHNPLYNDLYVKEFAKTDEAVGYLHTSIGQEASSVGVIKQLRADDERVL